MSDFIAWNSQAEAALPTAHSLEETLADGGMVATRCGSTSKQAASLPASYASSVPNASMRTVAQQRQHTITGECVAVQLH